MYLFLISFVVIAVAMLGMAVGVILSSRPIQGSCGGLENIEGLEASCDICVGEGRCRRRKRRLVL